MSNYDCDYFVIGGGSGGIASARRAAEYGKKVILADCDKLGGTCVNRGCVPKKVMHMAGAMREAFMRAKSYGWDAQLGKIDWKQFKDARDAYIERLNGIYATNMEKNSVEVIHGRAELVDAHTVRVNEKNITAEKILIATGGRPNMLNIPGGEYAITSDGFFELETQPKRVLVLGAGYIALELGGVLHELGSEVTFMVRSLMLRPFDREIVDHLHAYFVEEGYEIEMPATPTRIEKKEDGSLNVYYEKNNEEHVIVCDCVLTAVGRSPNTSNLGLENTKVSLGKKGEIVVDASQQTAEESLYAVGDVIGKVALTPVAIKEGRYLADRLFGGKEKQMNYTGIPTAIFTPLEIGTCGLSEEKAKELHGNENIVVYRSKFTPMQYALCEKKHKMLMKIIVEKTTEIVLGMHVIGPDSAEIIQGFGLAVRHKMTKTQLDEVIALHPSAAEEFVTMR